MISVNDIAVVYTVGDEMSFTEFIMALRGILAGHPDREDILDGHDYLNLSFTREHPVLPKVQDAEQPGRWLHIKLQVVEGEETFWTTLLMRDDNLYVLGFKNQQGDVYGLVDNRSSVSMLPGGLEAKTLRWSTKYRTMLGTNFSNAQAAHKLAGAHLGHSFATWAVQVLSGYDPKHTYVKGDDHPTLALAGLIVMVCESARMNPLHDAIAGGWSNGTGFTEQLMNDYVWKYGDKSKVLLMWKRKKYRKPVPQHPIKELQDIYLVLNNPPTKAGNQEKNNHQHKTALKKTHHNDSQHSNGGQKNQDSSSSRSGNQPNEADSHGSNGNHQNQGNRNHSDGSNGDDSKDPSQPRKDDESQGYDKGHGRPRVELLAMRANLRVVGTKIIVFDGKRGQIIYRHKEQAGKQVHISSLMYGINTYMNLFHIQAILTDECIHVGRNGGFGVDRTLHRHLSVWVLCHQN